MGLVSNRVVEFNIRTTLHRTNLLTSFNLAQDILFRTVEHSKTYKKERINDSQPRQERSKGLVNVEPLVLEHEDADNVPNEPNKRHNRDHHTH
jgi:hypothetical protein